MKRATLLIAVTLVFGMCNLASAATTYIGHSASYGQSLPTTGNNRADGIASLTYIFTKDDYAAAANEQIKVTEVNLVTGGAGTITPFIAVYDGTGDMRAGSSYTLLVEGDAFSVATSSLINESFLVSGVNPTINVNSGDILVAGAYQSAKNIIFAGDAVPGSTWIERNDVIPASVGTEFSAAGDADFFFNSQHYRYNIGFEEVVAGDPIPEADDDARHRPRHHRPRRVHPQTQTGVDAPVQ